MTRSKEFEETVRRMIKNAWKSLGVYTFVLIILLLIIAYCLYYIISIIIYWYTQRKSIQNTTRRSNNPRDPTDDNEVYINQADQINNAESNDEYNRYTSQINKSIAEFKTYNEKLKAYYKENKPGEAPADAIDKSIITNANDNYS